MSPEWFAFLSSAASAITAIIVCIVNNRYQNSKTLALIDLRLKMLEEKVDKHNDLVDRTYKLEETSAVHEEKIKVANNRIADLERSEVK